MSAVVVHPDRYGLHGTLRKIAVVVHTSEGGESSLGYGALLLAFTQPGDRDDGHGGVYGASYNAVANPAGGYTTILSDDKAPYSAPPWNEEARHIVMPGKASQTRAQWLGDISRQYIRGVAKYIVDSCREHAIPVHRLTVAEMKKAGEKPLTALGYCAHLDVSLAYGKTNHTDPGPNFPWDVLATDIAEYEASLVHPVPNPPTGANMGKHVHVTGDIAIFTLAGGVATWVATQGDEQVQTVMGTIPNAEVGRGVFSAYVLVGPLPVYPVGYAGGRTTAADFQGHVI